MHCVLWNSLPGLQKTPWRPGDRGLKTPGIGKSTNSLKNCCFVSPEDFFAILHTIWAVFASEICKDYKVFAYRLESNSYTIINKWINKQINAKHTNQTKNTSYLLTNGIPIISNTLNHGCAKVAHCVPLGDVTSPTTVAHNDVFWAQRSTDRRADKRLECKGEVHSSPLSKEGGFVTSQQWMGEEAFPLSSVICAPVH